MSSKQVAQVYNQIAGDFSKTRYRMWPCVERFINGLPIGVSVCEVGCGNGKNLLSRKGELVYSGVDISQEMVRICREDRGLAVVEGDIRNVPFPDAAFDHTMSVAVIHHLSERLDRIQAIRELLRITKPGGTVDPVSETQGRGTTVHLNGTVFITVWAFNQPKDSMRQFTKQDELVGFTARDSGEVHYRQYHLYQPGELESEIGEIPGCSIIDSGEERGNYWCVIRRHL
jgi:SAM-dependent methyltransferase